MRFRALVACSVMLLITGSSCRGTDTCSQGTCIQGPSVRVLLTLGSADQVIPITPYDPVGVLLPGKAVIVASDYSKLAPIAVPDQPPDETYRIFQPVYEPIPGEPWAFGGRVTLSSPAVGARAEWHVTLIIGTDPKTKFDGRSAYPSYFLSLGTETNLALGQTFNLTWPVGFSPPSSSDERVLAPVTGVITMDEGYANFAVTEVFTGPTYEQQLFAAVGSGEAVLSLPRAIGSHDCAIKDTKGDCLETPTIFVESRPTWSCSTELGCTQMNWDGISRDRPEQYDR